jgi:hypothetical protein
VALIHECGHLLLAVVAGLRLLQAKVGPLLLARSASGFRLRLAWPFTNPFGYVWAVPVSERGMRWRLALVVCAGPLASLIMSFVCLGLAPLFNHPSRIWGGSPQATHRWINALLRPQNVGTGCLNIAGLFGLWTGCANLIPFTRKGFPTDGQRLRELLSGGTRAERELLVAALWGSMVTGTRPRDWEPTIIERMLAYREGSTEDALANLYGYYYALDSDQLERADQYLTLALAQADALPVASQASFFVEGAYFEAFHHGNSERASTWLERSKHGPLEEQTRCRAEAAVLWAQGRYAEAASQAEAGLRAIPFSSDLGGRIAEKELLEQLLNSCLKAISEGRKP